MPASGEGETVANRLRFLVEVGFFDRHVFEFTGFEDFAALEALDEFGVFLTGNDLHARVFTRCHGWFFRETELKLEVIIRIATSSPSGQDFAGIGVIFSLGAALVKYRNKFLARTLQLGSLISHKLPALQQAKPFTHIVLPFTAMARISLSPVAFWAWES
jgi:hypothetical protein